MLTRFTNRVATLALVLGPIAALSTAAAAPAPAAPMQQRGPANDCVRLIDINGHNNLRNDCGHTVEIFWCQVGPDCDNDHGNTWSLGAGNVWSIGENVRWGACHNRDSGGFDRGTSGTRFTCS